VRLLIGEFKSVKLEWVRKADNLHAAGLAYQAINLQLDRELTAAETDSEDPENTKPKKDPAEFSDDDDDYYQHPISKNSSKQPQQQHASSPDSSTQVGQCRSTPTASCKTNNNQNGKHKRVLRKHTKRNKCKQGQ
jgi:type II secretory pathway pseudopilin PulG